MDSTRWRVPPQIGLHTGIYGWKKRCLYAVIILLLCVVSLNITLVFWLMKVLHLNTNGMNNMQMVGGNVQFTGKIYIEDILVASGLITNGETISVLSANNITFRTTDNMGYIASNIFLGNDFLEVNTPSFKITNPRGKTLFSVDKDMVSLRAQSLSTSGEGGISLEGSLQAPIVSADISSDLVLESATKGVQAVTPAGVSIESKAGDILVSSYMDINLIAMEGSIKLESGNVLMPTLRHITHHQRKHHHHSAERIYQLCVCGNGELYLGEADSTCESSLSTDICR